MNNMDRASFLRSLNFLRPVKPEAWDTADNNNDISIDMSGSTITPPTPSKSNAMVLFQEESMFVVSIEPTLSSDISVVDNGEDGMRKKRGRDDDMLSTKQKDGSTTTIGPAFFHQDSTIKQQSSAKTADTVNGDDNMDVDYNTVTEQSSLKHQTNSDPSLCTFEAVIIKKLSSELGDETTPNDKNQQQQQQQQDTSELSNDTDSKTLLFRFGGRFVFHVDESAILDVSYQSGDDEEEDTTTDKGISKEGGDKEKGSPPSKRQRNETGDGIAATKSTKVPPCLIISFSSCVLRVFSLKEDTKDDGNASGSNDTPNDKTSRIWGTLATVKTTVENRLTNAQTVLLQQFDIEERKHNSQHTSWKMAPPGSGMSFHSWPKTFEDSSFHINALQYKDLTFMKENWSACLGKKQIIECPVEESTSPQKSGSPSKSGSSAFENGQKDTTFTKHNGGASSSLSHSQSAPTENGASSSSKHDSKDTGASSELTNESQQNGGKDGDDTKAKPHPESQHSSQSLLSEDDEDMEGNDSKLEAAEKNEAGKEPLPDSQSSMSEDPKKLEAAKEAEDNNQSETIDTKQPAVDKDEQMASKEEVAEEEEEEKEATEQKSWKVGLYKKFRHFESSAIHMEQAIEPTVGRQNEESMSNLLTNCAESLSSSYFTANEFMDASQQCENEIEKTTSEMEQVLETMFPARGKKKSVVTTDQSENLQQRIEDLMASRRETVAAKLALLMTPKR